MGFDLDLAVSHPASTFSEEYKAEFARILAGVEPTLRERGLALPEPRPLPPSFPFRIHVGSYSSASALMRELRDFVERLGRRGVLPQPGAHEEPGADDASAVPAGPLPNVLVPLRWWTHLDGLHNCFVPVAFREPFLIPERDVSVRVASSVRTLELLTLVWELTTLDEVTFWKYQDVLPAEPGEPYRGYAFALRGFPSYPTLGNVWSLIEAMRLSTTYLVCAISS